MVDVLVTVCWTIVVSRVTLGVMTCVDDSTTTDPCDVTCDDTTSVVVDTTLVRLELGGNVTSETEADEDKDGDEDPTDDVTEAPVDRLTCLFSSFANASSISTEDAAEADRTTATRNEGSDHRRMFGIGCVSREKSGCMENVENSERGWSVY